MREKTQEETQEGRQGGRQEGKQEKALEGLGLGSRESMCYLALLESGSSRIGPILKRTGIPSSKIYEILDRLVKKGLVSYVIRDNVRSYQASSPKMLVQIAEEKKRQVEDLMPQLLLAQKLSQRQSVELFEGHKALFRMFTDLIRDAKKGERYMVFSLNEERKSQAASLFFKNLAVRRKEKRLDTLLLKNMTYYVKERHTKLQLKYTAFNLPQGLTIFRDKVIILSWPGPQAYAGPASQEGPSQPIAVRIESAGLAKQWRIFFLDLWKLARR